MSVRFYNPGNKIYEQLRFDHPLNTGEPKEVNNVAYFQLDAPEKEFFDVPDTVEIVRENAEPIAVSVDFASRLQRDFARYGLIRIDTKRDLKKKPIHEEENVAPNDKEAKIKGDRKWRDYLEEEAREHIKSVEEARANGWVPRRATGVKAHALKVLGIEDPADVVGNAVKRTEGNAEIEALKKQVAELVAALGGKSK